MIDFNKGRLKWQITLNCQNDAFDAHFALTGVFSSQFLSWSSSLSYKTGRLPSSNYKINSFGNGFHFRSGFIVVIFFAANIFKVDAFVENSPKLQSLLFNQNHLKMV